MFDRGKLAVLLATARAASKFSKTRKPERFQSRGNGPTRRKARVLSRLMLQLAASGGSNESMVSLVRLSRGHVGRAGGRGRVVPRDLVQDSNLPRFPGDVAGWVRRPNHQFRG